jgi:hypothetical protein
MTSLQKSRTHLNRQVAGQYRRVLATLAVFDTSALKLSVRVSRLMRDRRWLGISPFETSSARMQTLGMVHQAHVLTVLIASPNDVPVSREVVTREVEDWNRGPVGRNYGVQLQALTWELDSVTELGTGDAQEVINRQLLAQADIVIALFHSRLGTATARAASGTAEEILVALDRGLPLHVFVNGGAVPRDHDPDQLADLNAFIAHMSTLGLFGEFSTDDELARQVRLALDADVDNFVRRLTAATPSFSAQVVAPGAATSRTPTEVRDLLGRAADEILELDALASGLPVDGSAEWISETVRSRRLEIMEGATQLVRLVTEVVRSENGARDAAWLDLVPSMTPNPRRGGSTALINLYRAPGAILFHAGGLAACSARHDELTGRILTPQVEVDDPYRGPTPAVVSLRADLLFASGWPSKQMQEYLVPLLAEVIRVRSATEA